MTMVIRKKKHADFFRLISFSIHMKLLTSYLKNKISYHTHLCVYSNFINDITQT